MIDLMNWNVPTVTTEFKVNEEKRTVVCIITTVNDMARRLAKYGLADESCDTDDCADVRKYVGIAVCAPEDEWDEAYGKRLAEYRASTARRADINNELNNFVHGIRICIDNLCEYGFLKKTRPPYEKEK